MQIELTPTRGRAAGGLLSLLAVFAFLFTALIVPAGATAPDSVNQARLDRTVRYLQNIQNADGGYGGVAGSKSDFLFSAWVGLALAAAGINPMDQAKPGGSDLYSYLVAHASELKPDQITDYERNLMVVNAAGGDPRDFGGVDLVETILSRQKPDGSFRRARTGSYAGYNDTAFAILALKPVGGETVNTAIRRAAEWLRDQQKPSGGWGYMASDTPSSDMTGAILQALRAGGVVDPEVESKAWDFVRELQGADGGFAMSAQSRDQNTASTAWVVQGMWATGIDPRTWVVNGNDPLDYMASMQQSDGSIVWKPDNNTNPVWMTAYCAPAFAGHPLPIPRVSRAVKPDKDVTDPAPQMQVPRTPDPVNRGRGGTVKKGRGNAVAGGGAGAPLFSQPEQGSRGWTRGAERRTTNRSSRGRNSDAPEGSQGAGALNLESLDTAAGNGTITGKVIADPNNPLGALRSLQAAPGVRSAEIGGATPYLAYVICALLLCGISLGSRIELRPSATNHETRIN